MLACAMSGSDEKDAGAACEPCSSSRSGCLVLEVRARDEVGTCASCSWRPCPSFWSGCSIIVRGGWREGNVGAG